MQTPLARQAGSFGFQGKKKKEVFPNKDCTFDTLTLLEMDLLKFVSRVWNLKLTMATGGILNPLKVEVPTDVPNNITEYELWGDEDSDSVDL